MKILSRLNGQRHEVKADAFGDYHKAKKDFEKAFENLMNTVFPVEKFTAQELQQLSDLKRADNLDSDEGEKLLNRMRLKFASNWAFAPQISATINDFESFFDRWNSKLIERHDEMMDEYKEQEEIILENFGSVPRFHLNKKGLV